MIPDNNADIIMKGFLASNSTKKMVIVGDVFYKDNYADELKALKDDRLIFTGYVPLDTYKKDFGFRKLLLNFFVEY